MTEKKSVLFMLLFSNNNNFPLIHIVLMTYRVTYAKSNLICSYGNVLCLRSIQM